MTWIDVLREECERTSQNQVAKRLGVSGPLVSQVLHGNYKGSLDNIQARVEGELMSRTIACPILGDISTRQCLDNQRRKHASTNFMRVRLYQACRTCKHNGKGES